MGLYFEEFSVGQKVITEKRTITENDIMTFAALSGDNNRIHTDPEFSRTTIFGDRLRMDCWDWPSLRAWPGRQASWTAR